MYPQIELFSGFTIYTFGLALSVAFLLFFGMLYKLSSKFGINANFFLNNTLAFFLSSFIFSRLFYIIAEWRDFKFIFSEGIAKFLLMSDYNFSLIGGITGFLLVLFFQLRRFKLSARKYIDAIVLAFLFAAIVGFIGAFLGGQICGKPTDAVIGISYVNSPNSNCPFTSPIIPLAIIYSIVSFVLFSFLYMLRVFIKIEGVVGYMGMILFACTLILGEFYSGNTDMFKSYILINLNQLGSLILIAIGVK